MLYFYVIAKNLKFEPPAFVVVALCYQKVEKHFQFTSWSNVMNVNEAIFLYLLKKYFETSQFGVNQTINQKKFEALLS